MTARRAAVFAEVVKAGLGAVQFLLAVRLLGPVQYGVYGQLLAGALLIGPLACGGATFWVQPFVRAGGSAARCVRSVNAAALALGVPCAIGIAGVLHLISAADRSSLLLLALVECTLTPAWISLSLTHLASDRGGDYLKATTLLMVSKVAATGLALVLAPGDLARFGVIQLSLLLPIYGVVSWRLTGPRFFGLAVLIEQRKAAYQRGGVGLLSGVASQADKLLLSVVLPPTSVSQMLAAYRVTTYAQIPGRAWLLHAYPMHFELSRIRGRRSALRHALRVGAKSTVSVLLLGAAAVGGLALFEGQLFPGLDLVAVTAVLLTGAMLRMLHYALGDLLYAFEEAVWRLLCIAGVSAVYLGCLLTWGQDVGLIGVAWLSTGAEAALLVLLSVFAWRGARGGPAANAGE